jgi:hypothetical protein
MEVVRRDRGFENTSCHHFLGDGAPELPVCGSSAVTARLPARPGGVGLAAPHSIKTICHLVCHSCPGKNREEKKIIPGPDLKNKKH